MDVQTISTALVTVLIVPTLQQLKKYIRWVDIPMVAFTLVVGMALGLSWVAHYTVEPLIWTSPEHYQATFVMAFAAMGIKTGWKTARRIWPGEKVPK